MENSVEFEIEKLREEEKLKKKKNKKICREGITNEQMQSMWKRIRK